MRLSLLASILNLRRIVAAILIAILAFAIPPKADAYAILTHELLIDLTWDSSIVPLLKAHYPKATERDIINARAYAYGGALIQDGGYYAVERPFMSNVTHYVRPGDFVVNLFHNATNVDELAFAIGALAHYVGDIYGHREATNPAVYLSLKANLSPGQVIAGHVSPVPDTSVTYEQNTEQHTRVEFGFDVNALAHNRFLPETFHQAIGMDVELRQYSLAYYETYGLAEDFIKHGDFKLGPYHYTAFHALPYVARELTAQPKWNASDEGTSEAQKTLVSIVNCVRTHEDRDLPLQSQPKKFLGGTMAKIPKLELVTVDATTQELYARSVLLAISNFSQILRAGFTETTSGEYTKTADLFIPYYSGNQAADPAHPLANLNLDTGYMEQPTDYQLSDMTYLSLLHNLIRYPKIPIPSETRDEILSYFAARNASYAFASNPKQLKMLSSDLDKLQAIKGSPNPLPRPGFPEGEPVMNVARDIVQPVEAGHGGCDPRTYVPLQQALTSSNTP